MRVRKEMKDGKNCTQLLLFKPVFPSAFIAFNFNTVSCFKNLELHVRRTSLKEKNWNDNGK